MERGVRDAEVRDGAARRDGAAVRVGTAAACVGAARRDGAAVRVGTAAACVGAARRDGADRRDGAAVRVDGGRDGAATRVGAEAPVAPLRGEEQAGTETAALLSSTGASSSRWSPSRHSAPLLGGALLPLPDPPEPFERARPAPERPLPRAPVPNARLEARGPLRTLPRAPHSAPAEAACTAPTTSGDTGCVCAASTIARTKRAMSAINGVRASSPRAMRSSRASHSPVSCAEPRLSSGSAETSARPSLVGTSALSRRST
jgi:hypothetical protein